jgi:hypothetical protein
LHTACAVSRRADASTLGSPSDGRAAAFSLIPPARGVKRGVWDVLASLEASARRETVWIATQKAPFEKSSFSAGIA